MVSEKERVYLEYLVLHCQHKDSAAWNELIALYENRLFYFILQIVQQHPDALNVLQDTWLKAFRSISRLRDPASLTPWLYQIARTMALQFLRSRQRELPFSRDFDTEEPVRDDKPDEFYAEDEIHRGLKSLTPAHREVLILFYFENLSLQQIADIICVPVGTVRSRLHYAKCSLKAVLEKEKENGTT